MKILASGDLHGDLGLVKKLVKKAEDEHVDLVILTGDLFESNLNPDNVIGEFLKKNKKVAIIPGNHEDEATLDFISKKYNIKHLHGYSLKYDNIGIFGSGGAEIGPHPISEEEMMKKLDKSFKNVQKCKTKIMITHTHPKGSKMEKFSHFLKGSSSVKKALDKFQPDVLFCSHAHEAQGLEEKIGKTTVVNVSRTGALLEIKDGKIKILKERF